MATPPPGARVSLRPIACCWLAHGGLIAVFAALLPAMGQMTGSEDWAESMAALGAGELIVPMRTVMAVLEPWTGWLIGLGTCCILMGLAALRWRSRVAWGLHALAGLHLVLLPLSTWSLHRQLGDLAGAGIATRLGEALAVLATAAVLIYAIVIVERARREDLRAADCGTACAAAIPRPRGAAGNGGGPPGP
jgi:hypothetical protein